MAALTTLTIDKAKTLQIYSTGVNNNFNFIKEYALNNKLFFSPYSSFKQGVIESQYPVTLINTDVFETFRLFIKTVEEMFPSKWNLEISATTDGKLIIEGISIMFPEMEISNSDGKKHTLKDFVMGLPIYSPSGTIFKLGYPHGGRLTINRAERHVCYLHSHLQRNNLVSNSIVNTEQTALRCHNTTLLYPFCTGEGPITSSINTVNSNRKPTENMFIEVLINLLKLGRWESLEGGPYTYIRDVHMQEHNFSTGRAMINSNFDRIAQATRVPTISEVTMKLLLKFIKLEKPDFYPKFEVQTLEIGGTRVVIQNRNELFNILTNLIVEKSKNFTRDDHDSYVVKIPSGLGSYTLNIYNLMNLLVYKEEGRTYGINPQLLTLPHVNPQDQDTTGESVTYLSSGPVYFFRGEGLKTKMVENRTPSVIQRLDLSLKEVELKSSIKEKIEKYLENEIEQNI